MIPKCSFVNIESRLKGGQRNTQSENPSVAAFVRGGTYLQALKLVRHFILQYINTLLGRFKHERYRAVCAVLNLVNEITTMVTSNFRFVYIKQRPLLERLCVRDQRNYWHVSLLFPFLFSKGHMLAKRAEMPEFQVPLITLSMLFINVI